MRLFFSALLLLLLTTAASATPPRTLSYQGVLTDDTGSLVPNGSYTMTFGMYLVPTGGAAAWTETQDVTVTNGNFDVVLGAVTPITALSFNDPYWLGLQVGSDPEMTPRTELTGVAYSQISRTVEAAAITSAKIADNTVVRSLNGLEDTVNIVAGTNVTVTPIGNDIQISAAGDGANAPGVAGAKGITSGTLTSTLKNLVSRTINCPAAGYVLVIASADVYLHHVAGNPTYVQVGTSDETTALPSSQDLVAQIPFSAASGTYTVPLTSHGLYPVQAGNNTFYLLGRLGSVSGSASVSNRYMSLVYFEASYGTVSQTIMADPSEYDDVQPGDSAEVREAYAVSTDEDLARELAELRARLASVEAALER